MGTIHDLNSNVAASMAWFHFAILFVPVVLSTTYFEWKEWRLEHPRFAQRRFTTINPRWRPTTPFVMPM